MRQGSAQENDVTAGGRFGGGKGKREWGERGRGENGGNPNRMVEAKQRFG